MRKKDYRVFGGIKYKFYSHGTKREIETEIKGLKGTNCSVRRTKTKDGWDLWVKDYSATSGFY